jgi:predicted CopG family antitoxin
MTDKTFLVKKNFINIKIEKLAKFLSINKDRAFTYLSLGLLMDLDENNIDDDIVIDGEGDKQIDAILITEIGGEKKVCLIQTKREPGFSSNTVIQMGNGLNWIFGANSREVSKLKNVKLKNKIGEVCDMWDANISVNVYYCTLGDETKVPKEAREQADAITNTYGKLFNNRFSFSFVGARGLYDSMQRREKTGKVVKEKISYEFYQDMANMLDYYIEGFEGAICTVRGKEIARLVNKHGDNLFEANIRKFLGANKVNKSISETCGSEKDSRFFWFFNNGITIVCDSYKAAKNPKNPYIEVNNAQIVNGCQTATTLFNVWKDNKLKDDTKVLVKIFSAKSESFVNKITEATNKQTSISTRDLMANDKTQILIEDYLKEKYGYYYERKRNQYKDKKISKNQIINNEKVAQAFLAIGKKRPSIAKTSKARLFSEEFYEDIFSAPVEHLLIAYKIAEFAENEKKQKTEEETKYALKIYGFLHISRMIAYYFFKSEYFPSASEIDKYVNLITSKKAVLKKFYDRSFNELLKRIKIKQKKGEVENLNNFFKSSSAEDLVNKILRPKRA